MKAYFFELGNKYKKHFVINSNQQNVFFTIFTKTENSYIVSNLTDNQYEIYNANKNGFINVSLNNDSYLNNQIVIYRQQDDVVKYDNYQIDGLYLQKNSINRIVLNELIHLKHLNIFNNNVQFLRVGNNINLTVLVASLNQINQIDLSKNKQLKILDLSHNNLTDIDLSNNYNLQQVNLKNNQLVSVKLSNSIKRLDLSYNNLSALNINSDSQLKYLNVSYNQNLQRLIIKNKNIQILECLKCQNLKKIVFNGKNICINYDNLIAYFNFQNNQECLTKTSYINNGVNKSQGKIGNCLFFNDVNSCVYLPKQLSIKNYKQISYTFWISGEMVDAYYNNCDFVIYNQTYFQTQISRFQIGIYHDFYYNIQLFCCLNFRNQKIKVYSNIVDNGQGKIDWKFVCVTVDLIDKQICFYINGQLLNKVSIDLTIDTFYDYQSNYIQLCRYNLQQYSYIQNIKIDQFGLYKNVLTKEQIRQLYNNGDGISYLLKNNHEINFQLKDDKQQDKNTIIYNQYDKLYFNSNLLSDLNGIYIINDNKKRGYDRIWTREDNKYCLRSYEYGSWSFCDNNNVVIISSGYSESSYCLNPIQIQNWYLLHEEQEREIINDIFLSCRINDYDFFQNAIVMQRFQSDELFSSIYIKPHSYTLK